jgi:hypothetical protein
LVKIRRNTDTYAVNLTYPTHPYGLAIGVDAGWFLQNKINSLHLPIQPLAVAAYAYPAMAKKHVTTRKAPVHKQLQPQVMYSL